MKIKTGWVVGGVLIASFVIAMIIAGSGGFNTAEDNCVMTKVVDSSGYHYQSFSDVRSKHGVSLSDTQLAEMGFEQRADGLYSLACGEVFSNE